MKIPNYESCPKKYRSINNFIREDFRILVCGQSGSGKTNTVLHILIKPLAYYDKIYFYTPNSHQDKMIKLKESLEKVAGKIGYEIMEIKNLENIPEMNFYPGNGIRSIVVFDDVCMLPDKIQKKISNHFVDGRHHFVSSLYLSQSYFDTPKIIRTNCTNLILFKPVSKNDLGEISRDNNIDQSILYNLKPYEFIYFDKFNNKITKNFDESIL